MLGKKHMYLYAQASLKQFVASRIVCTKREEVYTKSNWNVEVVCIYRNKEFEELEKAWKVRRSCDASMGGAKNKWALIFWNFKIIFIKIFASKHNSKMFESVAIKVIELLSKSELYYIYTVIIIGLVGNTISFAVFIDKRLK